MIASTVHGFSFVHAGIRIHVSNVYGMFVCVVSVVPARRDISSAKVLYKRIVPLAGNNSVEKDWRSIVFEIEVVMVPVCQANHNGETVSSGLLSFG